MPDKFNIQQFLHKERQKEDELHKKFPSKSEIRENIYVDHFEFGDFSIEIEKEELGATPCRRMVIKSNAGEKDILSMLPAGYKVYVSFYPTACMRRVSRKIEASRPQTKGALVSLLHEMGHARRDSQLKESERKQLIEAAQAKKEGTLSTIQREQMMIDEKEAWRIAKEELIEEINNELQIDIVENQSDLESYIADRIRTYEENL